MSRIPVDLEGDSLKGWLAKTEEPTLDPEQTIVDPHHHLWDRRLPDAYREETPTHARYIGDDLMEDIVTSGHAVIETVFVECLSMYRADAGLTAPSGEVEFVQGVAAMSSADLYGEGLRCCGGIVGFADLTLGDEVAVALDSLTASGRGFRGIRQAHGWHASKGIPKNHHPTRNLEGLLGNERFRDGFARLAERALSFDCWGYHFQLGEVADLARAFPSVPIILDHIGGPIARGPYAGARETRVFDEWLPGIRAVAECPNVVVKLGGCGMPIYGFGYADRHRPPPDSERLAADWKRWFEPVVEAFGAERCMFESNFPVDKVSCSYRSLWNAFKRIADELGFGPGTVERNDLFYGTAARTYRLPLSDPLNARISSPAPASDSPADPPDSSAS